MRRLREKFPDELVVIGVHSGKFPAEHETENIRNAVLRHGIEHPVVNDADFKIWNSYTVRAWPTLIVIDPRGRIAGEISGEILADDLSVTISEIILENVDGIDHTPINLRLETKLEPDFLLNYPSKLLVTTERLLYIADSGHHRIIETRLSEDTTKAEVLRVFGVDAPGFFDGSLDDARFNSPHGMALSETGDILYVADTENHAIRAINLSTGDVSTIAGTGEKAHGRFQLDTPTSTPLRSPWALCSLGKYLFIAMAGSHQIWVMIDEKELGPFAGSGAEALVDGPLNECGFNQPSEIVEGLGHLFIADPEASAVRVISIDQNPSVITLIGTGLFDFGDQDGSGASALLQHPVGLVYHDDALLIADSYNHKIKKYDVKTGSVTTLIGTGGPGKMDGDFHIANLYEPEGLAVFQNILLIGDTNNHMIRSANLSTKLISTIELTNLDNLQNVQRPSNEVVTLPKKTVRPGKIDWIGSFILPIGTKLNVEAPNRLIILPADIHIPVNSNEIHWTMEIINKADLTLEYTIYYCLVGDERLCMVKNGSAVLPIDLAETGPGEVSLTLDIGELNGK